ncbi:MAG: hypothetical protein HZA53_16250 [Planctomycetes bacterium]|nr:hypothetical protein [Planctomycetota bacterium]
MSPSQPVDGGDREGDAELSLHGARERIGRVDIARSVRGARLSVAVAVLGCGSASSACASFHRIITYRGSERPPEVVAILRGSRFLCLDRVDGQSGDYMPALRGPFAYKGFEIHFLPGRHSVTVHFDKQLSGLVGGASYGGVYLTETTLSSGQRTLEFDGQAGRVYFVYSGQSATPGDMTWSPFIGDITGWEERGATPEP